MNGLVEKVFTPEGAVIVAATAITVGVLVHKYNHVSFSVLGTKVELDA